MEMRRRCGKLRYGGSFIFLFAFTTRDKQMYLQAAEDKQRYKKELAEYEKNGGEVPSKAPKVSRS